MASAAPIAPPDLPGYAYVERLGSGGYADVFLYEQEFPRQRVAIKVLKKRGENDDEFIKEANRLAGLGEHPNIVRILGAGLSPGGHAYMVMEYCSGGHLGSRARPDGLPIDDALEIGVKISGAVEAAHRAGILHRDIKPANILLRANGEPVLIDFGIAGERQDAGVDEGIGMSVPYAPPEILLEDAPGDELSDVYSLTATLYTLVAGRTPYEVRGGDNTGDAMTTRVASGPPPRTQRPGSPDTLEHLLQHGLARRPADRPRSVAALARLIQDVERSLNYRPTEFFVGGASQVAAPTPRPVDDAEGTRAQSLQVVSPSGPSVKTPAPRPEPSRPRVEVPDALVASPHADDFEPTSGVTGLKAKPEPLVEAAPDKPKRGLLIGAAVVIAVVVLAVVASSLRGGAKPQNDDTSPTTVGTALASPLSPVDGLTATRAGTSVKVAWVDDKNPTGTAYIVTITSSAGERAFESAEAETTIPGVPSGPFCVAVSASREGQPTSAEKKTCV